MGVNFDILEREGPVMEKKWNTMEDALNIKPLDPYKSTPYIADILKNLRKEVGNKATVLGFVGLPYTLATYLVCGPDNPGLGDSRVLRR